LEKLALAGLESPSLIIGGFPMSKKMLLLSVPMALLLTACNGDDRKPSAGLPDNGPRTVTATAANDDIDQAIAAGTRVQASNTATLTRTRTPDGEGSTTTVTRSAPKVDIAIQEVAGGPDGARLTVDGTTYELTQNEEGDFTSTEVIARLVNAPNEQSGLVRYDIRSGTPESNSLALGFAAFGALTPEGRVPTGATETATYQGRTAMSTLDADGNRENYSGSATVIANFGASEGDRFNGSEFGLGAGNGRLRVREGSASHSGNAFSASLSTGENTVFGVNGSGTMNGNFFGFDAEEVAGTLTATGNGVAGSGGFAASSVAP
jgi:hypothetical protein